MLGSYPLLDAFCKAFSSDWKWKANTRGSGVHTFRMYKIEVKMAPICYIGRPDDVYYSISKQATRELTKALHELHGVEMVVSRLSEDGGWTTLNWREL